ncbi:MAG: ferredoxin--NADP reductase [Gammaproteobacteria bacterium]
MTTQPSGYNATLIERFDITPHLAIFRVKPDDENYEFVAGQYTVLGLKRGEARLGEADPDDTPDADPEQLIRRPYSICSGTQQKELEFYISMLSGGELTPRLFNLKAGDRLFLGPRARGFLTLENVPTDTNLLMVATGTGLGPYISMLRSHAYQFPADKIGIIHGARYSWDLGYRPELESYDTRFDNVRYLPTISRPDVDPAWDGAQGRVQKWLEAEDFSERFGFRLTPDECHVFLCGNPGMIEEASALLLSRGFSEATRKEPGTLHVEKYW